MRTRASSIRGFLLCVAFGAVVVALCSATTDAARARDKGRITTNERMHRFHVGSIRMRASLKDKITGFVDKAVNKFSELFEKAKEKIVESIPEGLRFLSKVVTAPRDTYKAATNCDTSKVPFYNVIRDKKIACMANWVLEGVKSAAGKSSLLEAYATVKLQSNTKQTTSVTDPPYPGPAVLHAARFMETEQIVKLTQTVCQPGTCTKYNPRTTGQPDSFNISNINSNDNSCVDCYCKMYALNVEILNTVFDFLMEVLGTADSPVEVEATGATAYVPTVIKIVAFILATGIRIASAALRVECIWFGLA